MASNPPQEAGQLDAGQLEACVKQFLAEQQQQQPPAAQPLPAQLLGQLLGQAGAPAPPLPPPQAPAPQPKAQASLGRLVAEYLQASQPPVPPAALPIPGLLATLQAPAAPPQPFAPPPTLPAPGLTTDAARRQLLASARLLQAVNPGLAAAAVAQALALPGKSPPSSVASAASLPQPMVHQQPPAPVAQHPTVPPAQALSAGQSAAQFMPSQEPRSAKPSVPLHQISSSGSTTSSGGTPAGALRRPSLPSLGSKKASPKGSIAARASSSLPSVPKNPPKKGPASAATLPSAGKHLPLPSKPIAAGAIHRHHGHPPNSIPSAAAAAPARPTHGAPKAVPHVPIATLQTWTLAQLDAHVAQLQDAHRPVPQAVALLVADVRRREERRTAKRLANRRSACTSRARKKALVEEMTRDNARLRRQALILSYLPDPVVAISEDGTIAFASMQVERVLRHRADGLVGANIEEILVPESRAPLRRLIRDLVAAASSVEGDANNEAPDAAAAVNPAGVAPHEVSEQSSDKSLPPLREVQVTAGRTAAEVGAGEDVSDSSGDGAKAGAKSGSGTELSSLTHKNHQNSSFGPDSGEEQAKADGKAKAPAKSSESDDSSAERKANANLTINVEMCQLNQDKKDEGGVRFGHKDDVMGASVTANNAGAKLSSLMHHPKTEGAEGEDDAAPEGEEPPPSLRRKHVAGHKRAEPTSASSAESSSSLDAVKKASSEDSGYRESNESPEEGSNEYPEDSFSSSSGGASARSSKKARRRGRPLAPACNVRLVRDDLSTLWCELTSSIRTRPRDDDDAAAANPKQGKKGSGGNESTASPESEPEEKELLLCFRPLREGGSVGEELRFRPRASESDDSADAKVTSGTSGDGTSNDDAERAAKRQKKGEFSGSAAADPASSADLSSMDGAVAPEKKKRKKNRPPKKRKFEAKGEEEPAGKRTREKEEARGDEQSAVESLVAMSQKKE
ncbi:hypothetical protein ACHAXT_009581 [Thalassiosira profunda]